MLKKQARAGPAALLMRERRSPIGLGVLIEGVAMGNQADPAGDGGRSVALVGLESRYAFEVIEIVESAGGEVLACVRSDFDSEIAGDFPRLACKDAVAGRGWAFVAPLLTPGRRKLRAEEGAAMGLVAGPPIRHASAVVAPTASLGAGSVVGAGAVIGANVVTGAQFYANRAASVGHDCRIGDYCTIGPGATLCSACEIADGAFIGAGAVLCPGVGIGRNAVVGAGAVVTKDVAAGVVVAGNPARALRRGVAGYRDVGV